MLKTRIVDHFSIVDGISFLNIFQFRISFRGEERIFSFFYIYICVFLYFHSIFFFFYFCIFMEYIFHLLDLVYPRLKLPISFLREYIFLFSNLFPYFMYGLSIPNICLCFVSVFLSQEYNS